MKKIFMISIMVFMSVAVFGQNRTKIAKETIIEKLSEWSSPTNENYHKLKALGINADSLVHIEIENFTSIYPFFDTIINNQKDTVIVKHYSVFGKEKTDTVNAVVCNGMKVNYEFPSYTTREIRLFRILRATYFISNHYVEFYVFFDNQKNVIGIVMNIYKYFFKHYNEYNYALLEGELVSTIREFDTQKVEIKTEKFCEINNRRIVKNITIQAKRYTEIKDNEKKTKRSDNRVDDVY